MIGLKEYVNDYFDTHEQAIKALGMTKPTFYRRLKGSGWKVIRLENGRNKETHLVVNVHCTINLEINDGTLHDKQC